MVYIPVAHKLRENQHSTDAEASEHIERDEEPEDASWSFTDDAENVKLFLPSQLPPSLWSTGCMPGLHDTELKLRVAQTSDALEQVMQQLCIHSGFIHYKIKHVSGPGQKANTRARSVLLRLMDKVNRCAKRYMASYAALEILDPTGDWRDYFRPLLTSDLKGPNGRSLDDAIVGMSKRSKHTGEGHRELSWIWRVRRKHSNTEDLTSAESRVISESDLDKCECLTSDTSYFGSDR